MIYVLDTNVFVVCGHYFPSRFPSFWQCMDQLVEEQRILSCREVRKELPTHLAQEHVTDWVNANRSIFCTPTAAETLFVQEIFSVPHFQALVPQKYRSDGRPVADPFVIALAKIRSACVVTQESLKENAARIPNVCNHFGIGCMDLEAMMEREGWKF